MTEVTNILRLLVKIAVTGHRPQRYARKVGKPIVYLGEVPKEKDA